MLKPQQDLINETSRALNLDPTSEVEKEKVKTAEATDIGETLSPLEILQKDQNRVNQKPTSGNPPAGLSEPGVDLSILQKDQQKIINRQSAPPTTTTSTPSSPDTTTEGSKYFQIDKMTTSPEGRAVIDAMRKYDKEYENYSDEEIVDAFVSINRWNDANTEVAIYNLLKSNKLSDVQKTALKTIRSAWDKVPGMFEKETLSEAVEAFFGNLGRGMLSLSTLAGGVAGNMAAKGATTALGAFARGAAAGALVDATEGVISNSAEQGQRMNIGMQDEFSTSNALVGGAVAGLASPIMSGAGGLAGLATKRAGTAAANVLANPYRAAREKMLSSVSPDALDAVNQSRIVSDIEAQTTAEGLNQMFIDAPNRTLTEKFRDQANNFINNIYDLNQSVKMLDKEIDAELGGTSASKDSVYHTFIMGQNDAAVARAAVDKGGRIAIFDPNEKVWKDIETATNGKFKSKTAGTIIDEYSNKDPSIVRDGLELMLAKRNESMDRHTIGDDIYDTLTPDEIASKTNRSGRTADEIMRDRKLIKTFNDHQGINPQVDEVFKFVKEMDDFNASFLEMMKSTGMKSEDEVADMLKFSDSYLPIRRYYYEDPGFNTKVLNEADGVGTTGTSNDKKMSLKEGTVEQRTLNPVTSMVNNVVGGFMAAQHNVRMQQLAHKLGMLDSLGDNGKALKSRWGEVVDADQLFRSTKTKAHLIDDVKKNFEAAIRSELAEDSPDFKRAMADFQASLNDPQKFSDYVVRYYRGKGNLVFFRDKKMIEIEDIVDGQKVKKNREITVTKAIKINNKMLHSSIEALDGKLTGLNNIVWKATAKFTRGLQFAITHDPNFVLFTSLFTDPLSAWMYSDKINPFGGLAKEVANFEKPTVIKAISNAKKNAMGEMTPEYLEALANGVVRSGIAETAGGVTRQQKGFLARYGRTVDNTLGFTEAGDKKVMDTIADSLRAMENSKFVKGYKGFAESPETVSRLTAFEGRKAEGMSAREAAVAAIEGNVDFRRRGASNYMYAWTTVVPFMRAGMNVQKKFISSLANPTPAFYAKMAGLTTAITLAEIQNLENERYLQKTDAERAMFFFMYFPNPSGGDDIEIAIRKDDYLGSIGNLITSVLVKAKDIENREGVDPNDPDKSYLAAIKKALTEEGAGTEALGKFALNMVSSGRFTTEGDVTSQAINMAPVGIKEGLQVLTNTSAFGSPIMSDYFASLGSPEYQIKANSTTELGKLGAAGINAALNVIGWNAGVSPIVVDHFLGGITGPAFTYWRDVEKLVTKKGDEMSVAEAIPVLKKFVTMTSDPVKYTKYHDTFYNWASKIEQVERDRSVWEKGNISSIQNEQRKIEDDPERLGMVMAGPVVSSVKEQLATLNANKTMIQNLYFEGQINEAAYKQAFKDIQDQINTSVAIGAITIEGIMREYSK